MGRRTLLLIVSILIAAVGVALIALYVRGADQRADNRAIARYGPQAAPTPTPSPTTATAITHGLGITIDVPEPNRAAGLLMPGEQVAVYTTTTKGDVPHDPVAASVRVISVGPHHISTAPTTGEDLATTIVGLDVTPDQAHDIWQAEAHGTLMVAVLGQQPSSAS